MDKRHAYQNNFSVIHSWRLNKTPIKANKNGITYYSGFINLYLSEHVMYNTLAYKVNRGLK